MTVTWGEPPTYDKWGLIAAELRSRPMEWARLDDIGTNPRSYVTHIRKGRMSAFRPAGTFEAKVAGGQLWARYVGGADTEGHK